MANLTLKSQRQVQIDIITTIMAELGLNDVNPGSVLDMITNAVAQEAFAQYVQMAQIVRLVDLDAITGEDLDNKAFEYGLTRFSARKASGKINILREEGFEKVSTTFYAGFAAPIIGDSEIYVNDASNVLIGTSGTLILGRGTSNEEEVTYSVAPTNNINYYTYVLDNPLTKNHAIEESVILKQGSDELIDAGTQIRVESTGTNAEILFTLNNDAVLLAGEDVLQDVEVTAIIAGSQGNIAIKAIEGTEAWIIAPFPGARAENTSRFTTGRDRETDDELRDRIRSSIQSLSKGVKEAILNAIVGLVDAETAKRVVSANVVLPITTAEPVKVYIDDGSGFEPSFLSKGFEEVINSATGGEQRVQLDIQPVVKAQVENNIVEPYNMSGGSKTLVYTVGTQSETVTFFASDFAFPDNATAEEIVAAINDRSDLLEARTAQTGKSVLISAKEDTNEDLQVTGGTANSILGFPTDKKSTLYLFKNDILLSKDGETAFLDSQNQGPYNLIAIGAFPHYLNMVVDGKTANPQVITFQAVDFSDTAAATPQEIIDVINEQLAGARAELSDNGTRVRIISNTELSSKSAIHITGGSINNVTNGLNLSTTQKNGIDGDYIFNRETGTVELSEPLDVSDSLTAGSLFTRAKLRALQAENYAPLNGETLVIKVDGGSAQTITFDGTFISGQSAEDTASFINSQLKGATAYAREIGTLVYLEISTNTYNGGTIEITSASTANGAFGFTLDTIATSQDARKAYRVSGNSGPYEFREGDSLVVVMDNDIVNNTFSVIMDFDSEVSGAVSASVFSASTLGTVFDLDDDLNDFYVGFTEGPNTVTGIGEDVVDQGGGTFRILFDTLPVGLSNISVGDFVKTTDFATNSNNGFFLVTAISLVGNGYIEIYNANGANETGATATVLMSQKRIISDYVALTGTITVSSAFAATPIVTNGLMVVPRTIDNTIKFMNNTKISSLSLKSVIESVDNNTKVQISSRQNGSDGYVQITGGRANDIFNFSTDIIRGLQAYNYYTGLLKLVHRTIYGDDADLVSFPGVGAAGITFQVLAPTVKEIPISLNITLNEGISLASIENEVKSAITGYINNLGVGSDVIIEQIRARVIRIAGIRDVILNSPTANIAIADNELGRTRESLIVIG